MLLKVSIVIDRLSERCGRAVAWLALIMVLVGSWNALARYSGRFLGVDFSSNSLIEAQWYMFSLLFLLGASYTLKRGEHVRVDVIFGRLTPRRQAWIDLLGSLLLLIPFCVFAIIVTWPGVMESWAVREQSPDPGGLPRYPLKSVVPVAFVLLIVQAVSETIKRALFLSGRVTLEQVNLGSASSEEDH